jgi:hypothetical protein
MNFSHVGGGGRVFGRETLTPETPRLSSLFLPVLSTIAVMELVGLATISGEFIMYPDVSSCSALASGSIRESRLWFVSKRPWLESQKVLLNLC